MKTFDGFLKRKLGDSNVLLAGGDHKALSDFIGSISYDSSTRKIKYTPVGGSATDLVTFGTLAFDSTSYLPLSGGTLAANNSWLSPARLQLLRPDGTAYTDRACVGVTDGNLHIDAYPNKGLYLNYYSSGGDVYFNGSSYYINGGYYNGTAAAANSVSWANVTGGVCNSGQFCFSKTDDHAIQVGNIRGYGSNGQSGNYIHMYERVHIGSPSGWGSRSAPSYGLSTYGGAWLATDTGNVGIGTTSPSYKLHSMGTIGITGADNTGLYMHSSNNTYNVIRFYNSSGTNTGYIHFFYSNYSGYSSTNHLNLSCTGAITLGDWTSPAMYVQSTGNKYIGIGKVPLYKLDISESSNNWTFHAFNSYSSYHASFYATHGAGYGMWCGISTSSSSYYVANFRYGTSSDGSGGTAALYIRGDGNIGMGTDSPSYKLHVNGNVGASNYYSSSDINKKENIKRLCPILPLYSFNWKESKEKSYGFIAQYLEDLGYTELVNGEEGNKSVNYSAALSWAMAILSNVVDDLRGRIIQLENKLSKYENL